MHPLHFFCSAAVARECNSFCSFVSISGQ